MIATDDPVVLIMVSVEEQRSYAHYVSELLSQRFGIHRVRIRSAISPPDHVLSSITAMNSGDSNKDDNSGGSSGVSTRPMLLVVLGPSTSTTSTLETDSAAPMITLLPSVDPDVNALSIAKYCSLASSTLRQRVRQVVFENRQARLVQDAQWRTQSLSYMQAIANCYDQNGQITGDKIQFPNGSRGKVRDRFHSTANPNIVALVTSDRQSGFDRHLAMIPFKGAVLNLTSAYWFQTTRDIIPNHIIDVPHPCVSICWKCKPFPIEFVVRAYLTGSTSTSIWKNYQDGVRKYCGHTLPEGMKKNEKLETILLTPTTKEDEHDRPISLEEIVTEKWMDAADLNVCADAALKVFTRGQQMAHEHGLILVDTKYEFGREEGTGQILLVDEVHTPDSSRYWLANTYQQRMAEGNEPDNIDKEFLRLWFRDHCDPYKDEVLPEAPRDLVLELSRRYILLYEMITWKDFELENDQNEESITAVLQKYLS